MTGKDKPASPPDKAVLMPCACVVGKGSNAHYEENLFTQRLVILMKYVNSDENLELEVLLALQAAVAKMDHPPSEPLY